MYEENEGLVRRHECEKINRDEHVNDPIRHLKLEVSVAVVARCHYGANVYPTTKIADAPSTALFGESY